ncbi:NBAS subunit of NRZ tethering complex [Erpetoichthys calabaricus]|uniref:NBAS subunit of NRZ tethering complex n=1 Tax=Erpetoichthys calabaricus TaxID=27687 RepID=A0A8C4S859_ERPCA|nr:NBAS subunit of NRZ tethering complex [Erpetoichthys calabaricus]
MAGNNSTELEEENILYDLLINTEWPAETETQLKGHRKKSSSIITKAFTGPLKFILHFLWYSPASSSLPPRLTQLISKQTNWHLVLASNGKLLAVVQDLCVEIRSARDDFGSVIGKCQVPKDPNLQWRKVAWSHDCTLLAYAESTGTVRVFDLTGSELFIIPPATSFPGDLSYSIAGLIFLQYTGSVQWSAELLVINYRGQLKSYLVSVGTNQSYQENHSFNFNSHYSHGITNVLYHPAQRLLLVGGTESCDSEASKATTCGLTAWRILSGSPYYKQVTSYEDDVHSVLKRSLFRMPPFRLFNRQQNEKDGIFKLSLSPHGTLLAAIHLSGSLTLWDLPSLKQCGEWSQIIQPGFDEINPEWHNSLDRRKKIKDKESYYPLIDVNWWTDNAVILARCSGSLTVSSVKTLKNLLGKSCEWFEPSPQVTAAHDGGFLTLECEVKSQKRPRLESSQNEDEDEDGDSDSDDECSAKARYFSYLKQGLYYVTEMERFAPPRKRPRTITKNYRLVSLRSTTPEELYQRKIDNEEYGEALSLAKAYGLDSDLVYQRQWRKSAVSIASIQDYLSKIRKRSWVLHECVERVPENVDAAKELLQYGLKGTDLEALIAIGNKEDDGRFILAGDIDIEDVPYEDFMSPVEEWEKIKQKEAKKREELLKLVDFKKLTLEQKELCRYRLRLLSYLDSLATYEEILGGTHAAEQGYDGEFFKKFRNQNIVLSARTYARESNVQALAILFTYHGSELLQHHLAILSNFPETTSPHEYASLLPEACFDDEDNLICIPWNEKRHRDMDWCEFPQYRVLLEPNSPDEAEFLYYEQPELIKFRTSKPSIQLFTDWYLKQSEEIESLSRQVDCALSLVRLGMERNIPNLQIICGDLVTLETLVYESVYNLTLTLKDFQQMKDIDKLRLLMNSSPDESYVKNAYQWMVPFLHRCEGLQHGSASVLLREYLVTLAKEDLKFPLKIFQNSKPNCQQKIITDHDQLMSVALECIYNCERDDQLCYCYDILECLPQRGFGNETEVTKNLHDKVDQLEKYLSVAEVLEKHGLPKPISFVRNSQMSQEQAYEVMVKLTRYMGRKKPPVSETQWKGLLQDLLDIQESVYQCLTPDICRQIFTESLLCSSHLENIHLAGQMMNCSAVSVEPQGSIAFRSKVHSKVSYEKSVELVLAAASEYFNSSTSLTDDCMELARCCLQLIKDCPPVIKEELDLISALTHLEEFGVKILPLQVRMRVDRLSLIKECLTTSQMAYKQSTKLLGLADLLRVAGDNLLERKGQVLTLLAEQSLHVQDYKAANSYCQELMSTGYNEAWQVCSQLGQCESFQDLRTRQELMSFALTHCPASVIQSLLAASSSLQTQILYQKVNRQIDPMPLGEESNTSATVSCIADELQTDANAATSNQSVDLLHRTTAKTIEVLSTTSMTTKAVLHAVSDSQWWKKSISYLRPAQDHQLVSALNNMEVENHDLNKQSCNAFYESFHTEYCIDKSEVTYTSYQHSSLENFAEVLLRTGKLAETKSEGQKIFPSTEVLLQLASDAFPKDMTVALAYLLALPQVMDANKCFEKQAHSALSLQLAAYYYALQIYAHLAPCFKDKCHILYKADPKELINLVTKHVTEYAEANWPEELKKLILQLHLYNEKLTDFTQAQILQGLGRGVDVQRFSEDIQYKKETILGLAETLDESVYKISISLAQRYCVPLWEVYMTHLEFLFTDSGLSTNEIEDRIQGLGLLQILKSNPESFHDHMTKYVYPSIEGTDHLRLLYYFTLLEKCDCSDLVKNRIKPETHVRLLKKLKAVATGLNYRKLTDEDCDPLDALGPVLTSQNTLSISKLAPKIPWKHGKMLSPSSVYAVWLRKMFWKGDPVILKKTPQSMTDYIYAYDTCAKYFDKISPADIIFIMDNICFSPQAVSLLTEETRLELTKKALKAVKQISDKLKRTNSEDSSHLAENSPVHFEKALNHLQQSVAHLETLSQSFIVSLKNSDQELLKTYSSQYDMSRSEKEKVHELTVTMALDGQPLGDIQNLLRAAAGSLDISPKCVVKDAVNRIIAVLSGDENVILTSKKDPLAVLEGIVKSVHANVVNGGNLVSSDDMLDWLRPFCGNTGFPVRPRITVLQILEQAFQLSNDDVKLLIFFRTQTVLKSCWSDKQLNVSDVDSNEKRSKLFAELLHSSSSEVEFQHLVLLLQAWPPVESDEMDEILENPWIKLASAMMSKCSVEQRSHMGNEVLSMCRSLYKTKHKLPAQNIRQIALLLLNQYQLLLLALKLLVENENEELQALTLEQITSIKKVDELNCDEELLSRILDANLLVKCVNTAFYASLIKHLLSFHDEGGWNVEDIAKQMNEAGYFAEAGSLMLSYRGSHPALSTFNTALSIVKRWL